MRVPKESPHRQPWHGDDLMVIAAHAESLLVGSYLIDIGLCLCIFIGFSVDKMDNRKYCVVVSFVVAAVADIVCRVGQHDRTRSMIG